MTPDDNHHVDRPAPLDDYEAKPNGTGDQALLLFLKDIQRFKQHSELWEAVARLICRIVPASGGGIMIWDRNNEEFFVPAASIEDAEIQALCLRSRFSSGPSPFRHLFSTGAASVFHSFDKIPEPFQGMPCQLRNYTRIRMDWPLRLKQTMIGTLWAVNPKAGIFDADAAIRMDALAGITGSAMDSIRSNARLNLSNQHVKAFNQAKDHAADYLSHAIKTPLAVSIASLKLLERQLHRLPDISWKRIFDRTERNLKRLLTIEYELEDILRKNPPAEEELFPFPSPDEFSTAPASDPFPETVNRNEPTT
jgi:hypothetical protein